MKYVIIYLSPSSIDFFPFTLFEKSWWWKLLLFFYDISFQAVKHYYTVTRNNRQLRWRWNMCVLTYLFQCTRDQIWPKPICKDLNPLAPLLYIQVIHACACVWPQSSSVCWNPNLHMLNVHCNKKPWALPMSCPLWKNVWRETPPPHHFSHQNKTISPQMVKE